MFEALQSRFQTIIRDLTSRGVLGEADLEAALREVRLALLEADVNFKVTKAFIDRVRADAQGAQVTNSLAPGHQVIKIVHEQLIRLLGGQRRDLRFAEKPPTVIMLVGLHGTGKTTTAGKLANRLRKQGRRPLLVATDLKRPAAVTQLEVVGKHVGVPVYAQEGAGDPIAVARGAIDHAQRENLDTVIIDSAGRLHVDEELMAELRQMRNAVSAHEVLLVIDAMAGQDAVAMAERFHQMLRLDGIIVTKLDGDARGGAVLSVVEVTGAPVVFVGTSEKLDGLEPFHPDRMASRILGMGDVLTLIDKAQESADEHTVRELERKLRRAEFTLEDFRQQLRQVRKMGPLDALMDMIPGLSGRGKLPTMDERQLGRVEAIIDSMTPDERRDPHIIDGSRRRRIARGSGTTLQDVNRLLKQFDEARRLIKQVGELEKKGRRGRLPFPLQ